MVTADYINPVTGEPYDDVLVEATTLPQESQEADSSFSFSFPFLSGPSSDFQRASNGLVLFNTFASGVEHLSGNTTIGSNLELYSHFFGNKYVSTEFLSDLAHDFGIWGLIFGSALDLFNPKVTWGTWGTNTGFGALGVWGGPWGAVAAAGYFGLQTLYPGGAAGALIDFGNYSYRNYTPAPGTFIPIYY